MVLGITGSRKFVDTDCVEQAILEAAPDMILTGGAKGADILAENVARKHGIPWKTYHPKFKTDANTPYHARWYLKRNEEIVNACDTLLAFFAGAKSKGTQYTVKYARKLNKNIIIYPKTHQPQTYQQALF